MQKQLNPFNIGLLRLDQNSIRNLLPITSLEILEASKQNFHPNGLWSNQIFGAVGEPRRSTAFAYIDIKTEIIHPVLYKELVQSRAFYKEILSGESYATFSHEEGDFVRSNPIDGETGFDFFVRNFKNLVIKDTNTIKRTQLIRLFDKFKDDCLNRYIIVSPAGLRNVEFLDGRMNVDEVNGFYRKFISLANNINENSMRNNPASIDKIRYLLQLNFVEMYEHYQSMVEGKKKLFLGGWASRRIFNGTRNVISATPPGGRYMGDKRYMRHDNTAVGLFQFMKGILPIAKKHIKDGFLSKVFIDPGMNVRLTDPDTLRSVECFVDTKYFDLFQSDLGIESLIQRFFQESIRHDYVKLYSPEHKKDMYLGLCYKGPDKTFKFIQDIRELPSDRSPEDVTPITLGELLYASIYPVANNKLPMIVVRYPIAGIGSSPASLPFTKTTITQDIRYELDDDWRIDESKEPATSFPVYGDSWFNSMAPGLSLLAALSADFDGDTASGNFVYTDEAIAEILNHIHSFRCHLDTAGNWIRSWNVDTVKFVCYNLSDTSSLQA